MSSLKLTTILERDNWDLEKIKFFLTTKPHEANGALKKVTFPESFIKKIEDTPQFVSLDGLTYEEMKKYVSDIEVSFSNKSYEISKSIETTPHTYELSDSDFTKEPCLIMVDASLKKNGQEYFAGIAGCVRKNDGSIACGFAKEIKNSVDINTTTLELMAVLEGVKLADSYNMRDYTIVSDCIGNVAKIHNVKNGIASLGHDFHDNASIYSEILYYLDKHNGNVSYVPRKLNNIADEYSKAYQKRIGDLFNSNKQEILSASENILKNKNSDYKGEVYFSHPNNKVLIESNPYEMGKNHHLNYIYDSELYDTDYDVFILSFYYPVEKKFLNYIINPETKEYELLYKYEPQKPRKINILAESIDNLGELLLRFKGKKIAIFSEHGMVAKSNRLSPINQKEIENYQRIYSLFDEVKEISFFLKDPKIYNSILNQLNKDRIEEHYRINSANSSKAKI